MRDRGEIEMEIGRDCMRGKDRRTQFSMHLFSLVTGYVTYYPNLEKFGRFISRATWLCSFLKDKY